MARRIEFKAGGSFDYAITVRESENGPFLDISGWTITSQIRDSKDSLVATLTYAAVDETIGSFRLTYVGATDGWIDGSILYWDIRYIDSGGRIMPSATVEILVRKAITHP